MALQVLLPTALLLLTLLLLSPSPISSSALDSFLGCFSSSFPSNATAASVLRTPSSPSFDAVLFSTADNKRTLYANTSHKPIAIVTPTAASHVQAAVLCCRRAGLGLRTRSGGHDYEGLSFISTSAAPFVVVDVGSLRDITVDAGSGTAWAGAGAIMGELYYSIAKVMPTRGFPGATCPSVGLGGLLGGGGIGTLMRKYGVAADNIVDAVLVDAEGRVLNRAAMGEDLFWAIRGGGAASFGVVLSYKVKLVPVPPQMTVFAVWRTLEQNVTRILSKWEQIGSKLSDDLFIRAAAIAINNGGGRTVGVRFQCLFLGGKAELLAYLGKVFPELGVTAADLTVVSYLDSVRFFADLMNSPPEALIDRTPESPGSSFKAKSDFVQVPIGEKGFESIWQLLLSSTTEPGMLIMEPFGGVMDAISESATPFPHRKGNLYIIQYFMTWTETDAAVTQRHLEWMRKLYSFMAPYVSKNPRGAYLNYRDMDLGRNVGRGSCSGSRGWGRQYFKGNLERLVRVKGAVDPKGFFWSEQSIPTACA